METVNKFGEVHHGRNVKRLIDLKGIKQEVFASELGISQPELSNILQCEVIDEELLEKIANLLNVSVELIKLFNEGAAIYCIDNKIHDNTFNNESLALHQVFNPIEKVVELYERLLESEKEKVEILLKSINSKD